jgi:3-oxoacyl-[acyl-carrier protein] reductase
MKQSITNGTTIIFGGSGGIGSEIARALHAKGAPLLLAARDEARLAAVASELECASATVDLTNEGSVAALIEQASASGPIAAAAVCVGSILLKPAHMTSLEEWENTLKINATAAFLVVKHLVPKMREHGGSIVLFASAAAEIGLPNHEAIAAAKGAVIGLTRSAAATYAAQNIRINCIAPGLVRTPLAAKITGNPAAEKFSVALHPIGRLGEPKDIAGLAAWLLSAESSWTTGQVFTVDGGLAGLKVQK